MPIKRIAFIRCQACVTALALVCMLFMAGQVLAQSTADLNGNAGANALLEKHAALAGRLAQNAYQRPLYLESSEGSNQVSGNAFAVLDSPFSTVSATFKSPRQWCEVLILHLNTKYCRASADDNPATLSLKVGKKSAQELKDAFSLEFTFRLIAASQDYLSVQLGADHGPMSTRNYRIELQAIPLANGKSFVHLRYSYEYGTAGRLAMQGYLATIGSGKVGFTRSAEGEKSGYVGGIRGTVERNTMRYYLAIEAYLASLGQPPGQQLSRRMEHWFDATEAYRLQLHEVDRSSYLAMKKSEYQRQQGVPPR